MKKIFFIIGVFTLIVVLYAWKSFSPASANEVQLTAIGDSITFGTGDPERKGYIGRVSEKFLEEKDIAVEVTNFAIPRYTTDKTLEQLEDSKIRKQFRKADYIILYIGTNDFRKSADYHFEQLNEKKMRLGKKQFSHNLQTILDKIRQENKTAPILVLGLYHPYKEYQNEQEILEFIQQWNHEIASCAAKYERTTFVPVLDLFINQKKQDYFSDKIHLNPSGYQLMSERVYEHLLLVEDKAGS